MKKVTTVRDLRAAVAEARAAGKRIVLVPTMGNLHNGHASLVRKAALLGDFVIASIFVNPLQFGKGEDLDSYPRTLSADQDTLFEAGCDLLFAPSVEEMYPLGMEQQTIVRVSGVSEGLCGASRPGHFDGVSTVVCKLFNMAQPDMAVFGQKDYQQLAVIRHMVRDLNLPIEVFGEPTVRATDGLALSSRNGYLSSDERAQAPALYRTLQATAEALKQPNADIQTLISAARDALSAAGLRPDYVEIREALSLAPATAQDTQLVILAAAFLGSTRLIDNLVVERSL